MQTHEIQSNVECLCDIFDDSCYFKRYCLFFIKKTGEMRDYAPKHASKEAWKYNENTKMNDFVMRLENCSSFLY